jgi:hypothetical protein
MVQGVDVVDDFVDVGDVPAGRGLIDVVCPQLVLG